MTALGRYIPALQRMAAFASMLLPEAERNELRARKADAEEVLSRFDLHHIEYFSWGGSNRWHNIDPQLKADHKTRTQTDLGVIAKSKRISKREMKHRHDMLMKWAAQGFPEPPPSPPLEGKIPTSAQYARMRRKIPSRPFPKAKRKLRKK